MITLKECYDFLQWNKSRYDAMIDSGHPEDRANAEAPRLATVAWQGVAETLGSPDFDPAAPRRFLAESWARYLETGVPNDLAGVAEDHNRRLVAYEDALAHPIEGRDPPLPVFPYDLAAEVSMAVGLSADAIKVHVSEAMMDEILSEYDRAFPSAAAGEE